MIEKDGNGAKDTTQKVRPLRAEAVLRTACFIEDKTNYDHQKRDGLFTLQPRLKEQSAQPVQCGIQKRLTVSYIQRDDRLSIKQQRFSSKGRTAYSIIYAKDSKPNTESHKDLKSSICRSFREGIKATIRGNIKHFESSKSGALQSNESINEEINFSAFINFENQTIGFCFLAFRIVFISALHKPFIMSISVVIKAQIGTAQKS
jgi:hypothetical protein